VAERPSYSLTLGALLVASIAYTLQQTMIVPALPALQHDLHTTTGWTTWLLSGFLLSASVGTPLLGKLGDQHGKERLLVISLLIFLVGCIGAAAAWDIWSLIAFRIIQGAAGGIFPLAFSIIRDEFPPERMAGAFGSVSAVFGVGAPAGLILSGVIVDHLSWRWIFVIGAIPVAAAVLMVHRFVPESPIKTPARLDAAGAATLSALLLCLLIALTEAESWGWTSARILGLFGLSVLFLAAWLLVELRIEEPMVDVRMLARRTVLLTNLISLITGFSMYSAFVLVPNFAETPSRLPAAVANLVHYGFGASATQVGLYLAPGAALMLATAPLAGLLDRRFGSNWTLALGMALLGGGCVMLATLNHRPWQLILSMIVLNPGVALAFAAMSTLVTRAVRPTETGVANAMTAVLRTVGGVIGAQIAAAILLTSRIPGTNVPTRGTFVTAWTLFAVAALVGAFVALLVRPRARRPGLTPAIEID
jgi:EmrB/QacA subfamily drug resistance transporter